MLTDHGYRILARNVRCRSGEFDLIAEHEGTLCFIEVRSTSSLRWGGPFASIGREKRAHLLRAARWYLARHPTRCQEIRFDVVGILWHPSGPPEITVVPSAFDATSSPAW